MIKACASLLALAAAISATSPSATLTEEFAPYGLDRTAGDPTINPGDDFFGHVNGHWLATTSIPADRSSWNEVRRLRELSAVRVRDILEVDERRPVSEEDGKVGLLYATYMDEAAVERLGASPLRASLADVDRIETPDDLARTFARLEKTAPFRGFGASGQSDFPVTAGVDVDIKNPAAYAADLGQGGLGLPDRDYYTGTANAAAREAYRTYIVTLFGLLGRPDAGKRADAIIALETQLAASQWRDADTRDVVKTYNAMTPRELADMTPGFPWLAYLRELGFGMQQRILVDEPSSLQGFARLVTATPIAVWRDYVALRVISNAAPFLSKPFVDADFAYFDQALAGTPELAPRWKRGVSFANLAMGDAIGRSFVQRWFPPASKVAMTMLVTNIKEAMAARIDRLAWMSTATKQRARAKLANLRVEIGYPDRWRDYGNLSIVRGDAVGNAKRANVWDWNWNLDHLGRPVDRSQWARLFSPQFADAVNYGPLNAIAFPAADLGAPEFDLNADPAVNYGAIGAIIGHEITHSFDDQGAKLDEHGRLATWWTEADEAAFAAATNLLAKQYDDYSPATALHVDGRLTLGENTADLGGLLAALDAYHSSLNGKPAPILDGLTGDQRFFISFAQSHRELIRPKALRAQLSTNPHAPGRYRTATVRNVDAWYAAFGIETTRKLALMPQQRVRIW